MDTKQINDVLNRLFNEEEARIVFWNDLDKEFQNLLPFVLLEGVTTLRVDQLGSLETEIRLEKDDPTGKSLLYAPTEEPDDENDWLLDIRLYSRSFRADKASILLDQLGLLNHHLRQHLADRRKFIDAKDRVHKLKPLVAADDTAADLDRKILAVVVKADQPEFFNIVRTLFHAWTENLTTDYTDITNRNKSNFLSVSISDIRGSNEIDLDAPPPVWEQIEKYDLAQSFWEKAKAYFGYGEQSPTLKKFLLRLLVTDSCKVAKSATCWM